MQATVYLEWDIEVNFRGCGSGINITFLLQTTVYLDWEIEVNSWKKIQGIMCLAGRQRIACINFRGCDSESVFTVFIVDRVGKIPTLSKFWTLACVYKCSNYFWSSFF